MFVLVRGNTLSLGPEARRNNQKIERRAVHLEFSEPEGEATL